MSQIRFFTPEQEALIPEYQQKWRDVYMSTEPLCQELPLIQLETKGEYTLFLLDNEINMKVVRILKRVDIATGEIKTTPVSWMENNLDRAVRYANQNVSAEDFPLPTD